MEPTREELAITRDGHVATVEMRRPPHNYFDLSFVRALADAFERLDAEPGCRAIVLAAQGTSFCAGANLPARVAATGGPRPGGDSMQLYGEGLRLFAVRKPVVAAVQGPAIGGGLGVALAADFRVACPEARFAANFARLGFHAGFGVSFTLPRVVGPQKAALLLYTGRRIHGEEALAIGLADELVPREQVRARAEALAREIAAAAPIAVESMRATLRRGLLEQLRAAVEHESREQREHTLTEDFKEGVAAMAARREPVFQRR